MVEDVVRPVDVSEKAITVDPFSFFIGIASRITGLGGDHPRQDPNYVFHTPYFEAAPGQSRFVVHFEGLTARRGTLILRVHMLPLGPGARAKMVNSDRVQLNRLIQAGGRTEIGFEAIPGMSFALHAEMNDETDAAATGVTVWLERPFDPNDVPAIVADARNTEFGRGATKPIPHIISIEQPSFADPVSQIATIDQLAEPSYLELAAALGIDRHAAASWRHAYVLQILRRYGMLQPGARGLGLNVGTSPLPAAIIRAGASVVASDPFQDDFVDEGGGTDKLRRRHVPLGELPPDLINFDFAWSIDLWDLWPTPSGVMQFLENMMVVLRPGGLAVHVGSYRLRDSSPGEGSGLSRNEVERLLLIAISRGHEVAQFKVRAARPILESDGITGSVGIIFRKAPSSL